MAELSFHEKTKASKPNQPSKPTTYWIAVLPLDKKPEGPKTEEDYLWIKCQKKTTVKKIHEQYKLRAPNNDDFILKHDASLPREETTMKDLDTYGDHVIALEAIPMSEVPLRMAAASRQPLSPRNHQLPQTKLVGNGATKNVSTVPKKKSYKSLDEQIKVESSEVPRNPGKQFPNLRTSQPQDENISPTSRYESPYEQPSVMPGTSGKNAKASVLATGTGRTRPSIVQDLHKTLEATQAHDLSFASYLKYCQGDVTSGNPSLSATDVRNLVWDSWNRLPPHDQARFYAQNVDSRHETPPAHGPGSHLDPGLASPMVTPSISATSDAKDVKSEIDFDKHFLGGGGDDDPNVPTEIDRTQPKNFQLQKFIADASLEILESSVTQGVKVLKNLKGPLLNKLENSPDAAQWVQQIEKLQKQAVQTKTIIGVVGNTGAGKSSVINAMLDEERIVPTNCMRACTAVVTEISWNDTERAYRAEIEFITAADWEKELNTLFQDLLDGNGDVSRDCANEDTDAGIAYAKIKAVYPRKTKEDISNSSIESMLRDVSHILNKTRIVEDDDSLVFYKHLQHFVDSKEKATGNKDKDKKERREMEVWPLIKVVRLFVKSPALATGAVIVDLPGVHDSNAARAAVAEGYMKQCTGLWIVAPINRAVDDKTAKTLLGDSFKRQLKMDGGYNSVTFICSKTDDISLMEAQDSLGLDEEMTGGWTEMDVHIKKQQSLKKAMQDLRESKATYGEVMGDADEQLEVWEALRDQTEEGKIVYVPSDGKKRKQSSTDRGHRKKQRKLSDDEGDDDYNNDPEEYADEDNDQIVEDRGPPLTEDAIGAKITELRSTKKEARRERTELDRKIAAIRKEIDIAHEAEERIVGEMQHLCISGRNSYSKGAIQQDFAQGIKELDQEIAAEDDEENFNPDIEVRDYEEVARSLPVFCVSSRGYQKLQGRFRKDTAVPGFKTLEETQMPQLQEHCRKLTVAGRTAGCKRFMTNLSQLLNSMTLWASSDGSGSSLTEDQRAVERQVLQKNLEKLETGLEKLVESTCKDLKDELTDNIYENFDPAVASAEDEASKTAMHWGSRLNREDRAAGGYYWSTYKAICRRNGVYSNAQGPHNWNVQLTDAMMKVIASGWERAFSRRAPAVMASLSRNAAALLNAFHRDVDTRARKLGVGIAGLHMLEQQLTVYEDIFKDLAATTKEMINAQQKEISREFTPVIENAMLPAYNICTTESGPGSYMRMKAAMTDHVEQERHSMFEDSTKEVQNRLSAMTRVVEEAMMNKADEVFEAMRRDYRHVLGGAAPHGEVVPKWHRTIQKDVMTIIEGAEQIFKEIAGVGTEDKEEEDVKGGKSVDADAMDADRGNSKQEGFPDASAAIGEASDVKPKANEEATTAGLQSPKDNVSEGAYLARAGRITEMDGSDAVADDDLSTDVNGPLAASEESYGSSNAKVQDQTTPPAISADSPTIHDQEPYRFDQAQATRNAEDSESGAEEPIHME